MRNKTRPYNGIMELLLDLNRYNFKLAIVSNKFDSAVKELAKEYFGDLINVAIGESATVKRKPAPDSVFATLKELGSDIDRSVFVGDSKRMSRQQKMQVLPACGCNLGFSYP